MENDSLFLSDYDLIVLTGYKKKTKQIKHLRSIGITFDINGRGKPVVRKSDIDSTSIKSTPVPETKEWRSNQI